MSYAQGTRCPLLLRSDGSGRFTAKFLLMWLSLGYFKARFAAKFLLMWLSLLSPLVLPWPLKIVIDNVVLGTPTDPEAFPVLLRPLRALPRRHGNRAEMMLWVVGLGCCAGDRVRRIWNRDGLHRRPSLRKAMTRPLRPRTRRTPLTANSRASPASWNSGCSCGSPRR